MRTLTQWVLTTFTNPAGILILSALDSTLFFWLPFGVDAATVVFSMRGIAPWWAVALLATGGSIAGAPLPEAVVLVAPKAGESRRAKRTCPAEARRKSWAKRTGHYAAKRLQSVRHGT
jgi:membrane protein YqaA with SNARE-associated domain